MITIDKKKYEKLVTELIYTRDIRQLVRTYSLDKIFYFSVLKDISIGSGSPNYRILTSIARSKNLDENFIVEQAKSVLEFYVPFYQTKSPEYYEILKVRNDATDEEIRRSWIELMKSHHPDKVGNEGLDRAKKINEAYQVLKDNKKRDLYDRKHLPYIPVFVSVGRFPESAYYYAAPLILVAIVVLVYTFSSGWVFKSEEAQRKSAGVIEDTVQTQIASREADKTDKKEIPSTSSQTARLDLKLEKEELAETSSDSSRREKHESLKVAEAGDGQEKTRELAEVKAGAEHGKQEAVHSKSQTEKNPDTADVKPVKEVLSDKKAPEEIVVVSEKDRDGEKEDKALTAAGVTQQGVQVDVNQDKKSKSDPEVQAEVAEKNRENKSNDVSEEVKDKKGKQEKIARKETGSEQRDEAAQPETKPLKEKQAVKEKTPAESDKKVEIARNKDDGKDIAAKDGKEGADVKGKKPDSDKKQPVLAKLKTEDPKSEPAAVDKAEPGRLKTMPVTKVYTVREGDNLWTIARKFDTRTAELIRLNNLADNELNIGDELIIPVAGVPTSSTADKSAQKKTEPPGKKEARVKTTESAKVRKVGPDTLYTVQRGDSLWIIARKFDTTTAELTRLNNLADNELKVGEELIIRGKGLSAPAVSEKVADDKKDSGKKKVETARVSEKSETQKKSTDIKGIKQKADQILVPEAKAIEKSQRQPDRDSLYVFVSEYVSAYKNGDISKLESLFSPNAVENGVSIKQVLSSYRSNFKTTEILAYDIRIKKAKIINSAGTVTGDFLIMFKDRRTGVTKNSRGRIDWRLHWQGGTWKVAVLSYKVEETDSIGR